MPGVLSALMPGANPPSCRAWIPHLPGLGAGLPSVVAQASMLSPLSLSPHTPPLPLPPRLPRSVCHSATVWANAIMHAGTGVDAFLRTNLEWLAKATNWAKFGATAGLGVIQRGSVADGRSRSLLSPYLPAAPGSSTGSPYSEGGALYALGLIHVNSGAGAAQLLTDSLRATQHEVGPGVRGCP